MSETTNITTPATTTTEPTITSTTPFPPPPITSTPRLIIRPMHPSDAPSMFAQASPPIIATYMTLAFPSPYTLQAATTWISTNLTPPITHFVICLISSPETLIGGIGFKPGSDVHSHTAEIGYWLGQEYWGKGIVTEALKAMTDWTFENRGDRYRKLWAGVYHENEASLRVLEKCGYKWEGRLREHVEGRSGLMDLVLVGITKGEWEKEQKEKKEGKVDN